MPIDAFEEVTLSFPKNTTTSSSPVPSISDVSRKHLSLSDDFIDAPVPDIQPEPIVDPAKKPFRREIDLKDGSGVQVFEADTADDLIDKLTTAQEHATRKIRQLNQRKKAEPQKENPHSFTELKSRDLAPEEVLLIQDLWNSNPQAAFDKLIEARIGLTPNALADTQNKVQRMYASRMAEEASVQFVADHQDDYANVPANGKKIHEFLTSEQLCVTRDNLEYAFEQLSAKNELVTKSSTPAPVVEEVKPQPKVTTSAPPPVTLSDRSSQRPEPGSGPEGLSGTDIAALSNIPLKDLKARIGQMFLSQRGTQR